MAYDGSTYCYKHHEGHAGTCLSCQAEQEKHEIVKVELSHLERKQRPMCTGVLDYFPDALLEVAYVSFKGNEQHNPGEPLHWAKDKSIGCGDEIVRHLIDRGKMDSDGTRHTAKLAWRALELLQREIESERK